MSLAAASARRRARADGPGLDRLHPSRRCQARTRFHRNRVVSRWRWPRLSARLYAGIGNYHVAQAVLRPHRVAQDMLIAQRAPRGSCQSSRNSDNGVASLALKAWFALAVLAAVMGLLLFMAA